MSKTSEKYKTSYYLSKKNDRNTIVFIHGVGLTKEIWDQQVEFFKNYNILTYDLLGHGKTPLEKSQLTFDDEIIIAIGGASSGRAHARTGDRYQDMKEMGIEPK